MHNYAAGTLHYRYLITVTASHKKNHAFCLLINLPKYRQLYKQPAHKVSFDSTFVSCPLGKTKALLLCKVLFGTFCKRMSRR